MGHDLDNQELKATRELLGLDRNKSIEEDIKKLENLIVTLPNFHLGGGDSIERILQDYKRQKQINEEHRKVNGELREKVRELEIDLTTVYIKGVEDGKDKYKQKIKDKKEEFSDKARRIAGTYQYADSEDDLIEKKNKVIELRTKAEAFEELLQESEDK